VLIGFVLLPVVLGIVAHGAGKIGAISKEFVDGHCHPAAVTALPSVGGVAG
jgi:hypothetical protein